MTNDEKMDYWSKMIHKHDHKIHEVDCIITIRNYLIEKLGEDFWNIEPEFQACVKRHNGKHALIDLYFPFCNIGIEVDEAGHIGQELKDLEREVDIIEQLKALGRPNYEVLHINCHDGWEVKKKDLYKAANRIVSEYLNLPNKIEWNDISGYEYYKDKTVLSAKDLFIFKNMSDAANTILRTHYYGNDVGTMQGFPKNHVDKNWKYHFTSFYKDNVWVRKHTNEFYYNDFAEDMSEIKMYSNIYDDPIKTERSKKYFEKLNDKIRIVFCKNKELKTMFCGLYRCEGIKKAETPVHECNYYEHYVKISDEYHFVENIFNGLNYK